MRRLLLLLPFVALVSSGCINDDPTLGVSPTATGLGVRAYIDNCPAATRVRVRTGDTVLWEIDRAAPTRTESSDFDLLIGEAPPGWRETIPLAEPLSDDASYLLTTEPEGDLLEFALDDLSPGRLLTETGEEQATPLRIERPCPEETASAGEFTRDVAVLVMLGATLVAAIGIVVILLLHLFNRILRRPSL